MPAQLANENTHAAAACRVPHSTSNAPPSTQTARHRLRQEWSARVNERRFQSDSEVRGDFRVVVRDMTRSSAAGMYGKQGGAESCRATLGPLHANSSVVVR